MGFFSNLFTPREHSAEEVAATKMALLKKRLRNVTLRLTHKRITMQEGENVVAFEKLQQLSDSEVLGLPEENIVVMAGIYRRCIGEGGYPHEAALKLVNSTRIHPIHWKDISKFKTIEEYIVARLEVELAAMDAKKPILKYLTQDFISNAVQESNLVFHEIFGY